LEVEQTNAPIGLWPELEFKGEEINYFHNRLMLLYTDGLNEAENQKQEQYGEDRIIEQITSHATQNAQEIVKALKADTNLFRDGAEQNDDLTILAFRYN
jgi:serine phosphatase RsbU (regulator of sigma subunit)